MCLCSDEKARPNPSLQPFIVQTPMKTDKIKQSRLSARDYPDSKADSRTEKCTLKSNESITYMILHLVEPLRVSALATYVYISPSHFFYLFKRCVGSTPIDYFIRLRLRRACHLLENTDMSIKAIAYTLGYDDPFYFSRIFKTFNRMTPSRYRCLNPVSTKDSATWSNGNCRDGEIVADRLVER